MKVETTSPKAVITRGPSKMAPNATPTASEQVPANDGRCNAVNTKSKPVAAASCRLVSAPCSIFRATVRKLCPKKGALTTVQTTACCHGKNPSRICNLLPLLTGMTHPAPIESKLQSKTSRHPPNPKLLSEHPQPLSAPPELRSQELVLPPSIATCRRGLSPGRWPARPLGKGRQTTSSPVLL